MDEVIIVGGGIMGCAAAYHLAKSGCRVTVLEKGDIAQEASGRNVGSVRVQMRHPLEFPLAREAVRRWKQLDEELDTAVGFRTVGTLMVTYHERELSWIEQEIARHRALGLDVALLRGKELKDVVPGLSDAVVGGMYSPVGGQVNPQRASLAFGAAAKRAGARIHTGVKVESIQVVDGQVVGVQTEAGEYPGDRVLLAAGVWTPHLARPLGLDLPITPWHHQVLVTSPMSRVTYPCVLCTGPRVSTVQTADGTVLFNVGPPENVGFRSGLTQERVLRAASTVASLMPGVRGAQVSRMWSGWYEVSGDDLPILGPLESPRGLIVAAGFSGHGFALAPVVGRILAELILGEKASFPIEGFRPSRFTDSRDRTDEPRGEGNKFWTLTAEGSS